MKTSQKHSVGFTAALLLLGASAASAANITINDNNVGIIGNSEVASGWYKGGATYMATVGATEQLSEYQEVEPGMAVGSGWDLASFVNPYGGRLGVVSAYDLANGFGGTTIGDIMVSVTPGSLTSYPDPQTAYSQFTTNADFKFDFAVKFDFTAGTYKVLKIDLNTVMENGEYASTTNYNSASQPWRVANGYTGNFTQANGFNLGTEIFSGSLLYTNTLSDVTATSLNGYSTTNEYKYYAEISTTWLNPFLATTNPVALYKLTMECGNDNLVGVQTSGFNTVPDGSATLALLGLSFLGLVGMAKFKNRKAV